MIGLSNKVSAEVERKANEEAISRFQKRTKETGKAPGTHTLGVEYKVFAILNDKGNQNG